MYFRGLSRPSSSSSPGLIIRPNYGIYPGHFVVAAAARRVGALQKSSRAGRTLPTPKDNHHYHRRPADRPPSSTPLTQPPFPHHHNHTSAPPPRPPSSPHQPQPIDTESRLLHITFEFSIATTSCLLSDFEPGTSFFPNQRSQQTREQGNPQKDRCQLPAP